jgi:hypothetical protein
LGSKLKTEHKSSLLNVSKAPIYNPFLSPNLQPISIPQQMDKNQNIALSLLNDVAINCWSYVSFVANSLTIM